jgi:hypothetical protein
MTDRDVVEAFVKRVETDYALARYKSDKLDAELKMRTEGARRAFEQANAGLIEQMTLAGESERALRLSYETACLKLKELRETEGETGAKLTECAQVKMQSTLDYDRDEVLNYLIEHRLSQFLAIDKKAFETAAPHLLLYFVEEGKTPKLYVSQDMIKALQLDTSKVDREIELLIDSLDTRVGESIEGLG